MKDIIDNRGRRAPHGSVRQTRADAGAFDTSIGGRAFTLEAHVTSMLTDHTPLYTLSSGYHERIYLRYREASDSTHTFY
jgi:hypothetical protein